MEPRHSQPKEFEEKVIEIKRLSKKTKGGNKISFSALVVIGDTNGRAGVGLDKANDVLSAIQKAIRKAKNNLVTVTLANGTIPHEVYFEDGAAKILLKPAPVGTGVIAGGPVRAVVEAFGIKNIVSKCMGTANKTANVLATFKALRQMKIVAKQTKHADKPVQDKETQPVKKEKTEKKVKKVSNNDTVTAAKPKKTAAQKKTKS